MICSTDATTLRSAAEKSLGRNYMGNDVAISRHSFSLSEKEPALAGLGFESEGLASCWGKTNIVEDVTCNIPEMKIIFFQR